MYSILVDRVIDLHRTVQQAALIAQAMGRRLTEAPPSLEQRLELLATTVGMTGTGRRALALSDEERALRAALGLRTS